jgi:hypothetical protein
MDEIGVSSHHESVSMTKEQMLRLASANFTMVLRNEGLDFFRSDRLIDGAVFAEDDLTHYAAGNLQRVRFPMGVELTEKAYQRFRSQMAIPVSTSALRSISNNAMAIDIFIFFSFKLPLITRDESVLVKWQQLIAQFGDRESKSRFRQVFETSINKAKDAYAGANVDITDEGLVLRYSDPVEARKMFVVSSINTPSTPLQRIRKRNRIVAPTSHGSTDQDMDF